MLFYQQLPGRILLITGLLAFAQLGYGQSNTWVRKNDVGYNGQDGPRIGLSAPSFGVGGKGYVIGVSNQFWEYDPVTDTWSSLGVFPGGARSSAACFTIGSKGYVSVGSGLNDTWEYDPVLNTWTLKAAFPGLARIGPSGFAIGTKGYVCVGRSAQDQFTSFNDVWEFDPQANTWTQKANVTGLVGGRAFAVAFSIAGKGYLGTGSYYNGNQELFVTGDFREYDPATDSWITRASISARRDAVAFGLNGKGYVCNGRTIGLAEDRIQEYDPASNTWTNVGDFGDSAGRHQGFGFVAGSSLYVGGGEYYGDFSKTYYDFWAYEPASDQFTPRQSVGGLTMRNSRAFGLGSQAHFIGGSAYQDLVSQEVWDYTPSTNTWTKQPASPISYEAGAVFTLGEQGYVCTGERNYPGSISYSNASTKYAMTSGAWSSAASVSAGRGQAIGFSAGGKGYIGLGVSAGGNRNDMWRHDPVLNTWIMLANFPGAARREAVAFRIGDKVYAGTGYGIMLLRDMWMYDPATDTWTQKADFGGTARRGAVAFTLGGKGYIATGDDGAKRNDLWEYDPITDTWTQRASFGGAGRSHAMAFVVGSKAYVGNGATSTSGSAYDMWEYTAVDAANAVQLRPKVFLEGPFNSGTGLMSDALRTAGLVPLTEPYTALGYDHAMSGGETTTPAVLAVTGNNAIVDWVVVELRHSAQPSLVVASACALVQRDGDVVGVDGTSPVRLFVGAGNYHVAIRHRNHLGAMTASTVALTPTASTVNLTSSSTATYGSNARKTVGSAQVLWAGDPTRDNSLRYTGSGNDRDPILVKIGGTTPNSTVAGYFQEDVNLDGLVKYTGASNDRDPVLVNVGSTTPNNVRLQQLP